MNTFVLYAEINAICIAVIAIIAVTSYSHLERKDRKKRRFLHSASLIAEVVRQDRRSRSTLSYPHERRLQRIPKGRRYRRPDRKRRQRYVPPQISFRLPFGIRIKNLPAVRFPFLERPNGGYFILFLFSRRQRPPRGKVPRLKEQSPRGILFEFSRRKAP